jgi:hypothetical protein
MLSLTTAVLVGPSQSRRAPSRPGDHAQPGTPDKRNATHPAVSTRAADGCIARMMQWNRARSTSDAALLLLYGIGLLVRHARDRAARTEATIGFARGDVAHPRGDKQASRRASWGDGYF